MGQAMPSGERRVVVVTGSTRGIGRGIAEAVLALGANVVVSGRGAEAVARVASDLGARHGQERAMGHACDVTSHADVEALWDAAKARFGSVDSWVSSAGTSNPQRPFQELDADQLASVVDTNLLGTMYGARVALRGMHAQGHGTFFTMEGFGSDGAVQPGMALYGSTKRAIRYLTKSLAREARGTPVRVCSLSPGIVVTDLLVSVYAQGRPENWARQRWLFNLIADRVEDVAPWLARRILDNPKNGAHLAWMTVPKAVLRVFQPRYHRRDLFAGTALGAP
jgi:NAD(P)-dependent dehydrogenase (short-subunit alcohol dehydrogenase family)